MTSSSPKDSQRSHLWKPWPYEFEDCFQCKLGMLWLQHSEAWGKRILSLHSEPISKKKKTKLSSILTLWTHLQHSRSTLHQWHMGSWGGGKRGGMSLLRTEIQQEYHTCFWSLWRWEIQELNFHFICWFLNLFIHSFSLWKLIAFSWCEMRWESLGPSWALSGEGPETTGYAEKISSLE